MLELDAEAQEEDLTQSLMGAIDRVHTAMVTYAARDSEYDGQPIHAGEFLGLFDGSLLGSDKSLDSLMQIICDNIAQLDAEFISVYYGEDVSMEDGENTGKTMEDRFPGADVSVVNGGQPVYYYMISAE